MEATKIYYVWCWECDKAESMCNGGVRKQSNCVRGKSVVLVVDHKKVYSDCMQKESYEITSVHIVKSVINIDGTLVSLGCNFMLRLNHSRIDCITNAIILSSSFSLLLMDCIFTI